MRYPRRIRLFAALVALVGLLFTQLALASYDCPQLGKALAQSIAAGDGQAAHASCCAPHDEQNPNVCEAHGQAKSQSPDLPAQPPVAPFIPARLVLAISAVDIPLPPDLEAPAAFLAAPGSSPPISIRHCCLRN